jgi:aspartate racemase
MYDLGILGGMGPKATEKAFGRVIDYTLAKRDQDHINMVILNHAEIPDRTEAMQNGESGVAGLLARDFEVLARLSVPVAVAVCNTAHYFIRQLEIPEGLLFIDMIGETKRYMKATYGDKTICVLGTRGLIASEVYGAEGEDGIAYPSGASRDALMDVIHAVKAGSGLEELLPALKGVMDGIARAGDTVFALACTELSLFRDMLPAYATVDSLDVALCRAITQCGYRLNEKPAQHLANIGYFS